MRGFRNLFSSRANYVFDYKPRFYDEREERIKKLEEKYATNKSSEDLEKTTISLGTLRNEWKRSKHVAHDVKTNRRLAIIISVLVGVAFYIFDLHKLF